MARTVILPAVLAAIVVAACGGTPSPTTGPGGGGPTAGSGATTPGGGGGGGGGGALDDPCALLQVGEVAGALGSDPVTAAGTPGDPATCRYSLGPGDEAVVFDILRNGAAAQFQSFIDAGSGESVAGIGDSALYEPSSRRLLVRSGEYLLMFFSRLDGLEASSAMARIAVARLSGGTVPPDIRITAPPIVKIEAACELLTPEEAAAVIGKGPMEAQKSEFTPQFCSYAVISTGEVVLSTFFQAKGAVAAWDGYGSSAEPVSGLGDKAMFESGTGILFVLKADSMFNVNVYLPDPATALDPDLQVAQVMLGKL